MKTIVNIVYVLLLCIVSLLLAMNLITVKSLRSNLPSFVLLLISSIIILIIAIYTFRKKLIREGFIGSLVLSIYLFFRFSSYSGEVMEEKISKVLDKLELAVPNELICPIEIRPDGMGNIQIGEKILHNKPIIQSQKIYLRIKNESITAIYTKNLDTMPDCLTYRGKKLKNNIQINELIETLTPCAQKATFSNSEHGTILTHFDCNGIHVLERGAGGKNNLKNIFLWIGTPGAQPQD